MRVCRRGPLEAHKRDQCRTNKIEPVAIECSPVGLLLISSSQSSCLQPLRYVSSCELEHIWKCDFSVSLHSTILATSYPVAITLISRMEWNYLLMLWPVVSNIKYDKKLLRNANYGSEWSLARSLTALCQARYLEQKTVLWMSVVCWGVFGRPPTSLLCYLRMYG